MAAPITNFKCAISDVYHVTHDGMFYPDFLTLKSDLEALRGQINLLEESYQEKVLVPFLNYLSKTLKKEGFDALFFTDEGKLTAAELGRKHRIIEVAEALLQRNQDLKYFKSSFKDLRAFQAIVSSLFTEIFANKFFHLPFIPHPPLARWGSRKGPYTHPINLKMKMHQDFGIRAGIVNLPVEHKHGGLLAWFSLAHEIVGHHLLRLDGDNKFLATLSEAVEKKLRQQFSDNDSSELDKIATYWKLCTEEAASDLVGLSILGPAFILGFVGYFRGKRGGNLKTKGPLHTENSRRALKLSTPSGYQITYFEHLSNTIQTEDSGIFGYQDPRKKVPIQYEMLSFPSGKHPLDVLRLQMLIAILKKWGEPYTDRVEQFQQMLNEDLKDSEIILQEFEGVSKSLVDIDFGKEWLLETAQVVGETLLETPFIEDVNAEVISGGAAATAAAGDKTVAPEKKCISEIFCWSSKDEDFVNIIRDGYRSLDKKVSLGKALFHNGARHRHILAAAVIESCENSDMPLEQIFYRMKRFFEKHR